MYSVSMTEDDAPQEPRPKVPKFIQDSPTSVRLPEYIQAELIEYCQLEHRNKTNAIVTLLDKALNDYFEARKQG